MRKIFDFPDIHEQFLYWFDLTRVYMNKARISLFHPLEKLSLLFVRPDERNKEMFNRIHLLIFPVILYLEIIVLVFLFC